MCDWRVSLHGGHSGEYCDHAGGRLRDVLEAAIAAGFRTYGISEHAPRLEERFLYSKERELGWTVETLERKFAEYASTSSSLADEYRGRLTVLRGFEAEVVPAATYRETMLGYQERYRFDYMVGSVHYVGDFQIDGSPDAFAAAVRAHAGLERLCIAYYRTVAQMVRALRPAVVGHFDVIRKNGSRIGDVETPAIKAAAFTALEAVSEDQCILDLNTAGYRKGLGSPYPASWIVHEAERMGIGFCFGDDSHEPEQVGAGIDDAREYLLAKGVTTVDVLRKDDNGLVKRAVPLK
jgi:histidinol-phosphatase (PHP family)